MAVYEEKWYTGTTSPGPYNFTFPYIKEADVKVEKNGTLLTLTTEYTQATTSITLVSNPAETDIIRVYRDTDSENLSSTFYPGSAIRSSDLNDNFTQSLYSSQESAEKAKDALRATDAFIATTSNEGDTWVTAGNGTTHGQDPNPDPRGIGYAVTTSEAADVKSDAAVETADDAELLVHTYVADGNGNLKGGGAPDGQPEGVKYAVDVAVAADNIADLAKIDADNAILATDSLVGTTTDNGVTWTLKGDGISPNPQGVAYAVGKADDAVGVATDALDNSRTKTDGSEAIAAPGTYTSAIYLADQANTNATTALDNSRNSATPPVSAISIATDAAIDAAEALSNSRNTASPPVSAITIAEDAYNNAVKQDGVTPSGGPDAAINIAEAAEVTAGNAVATANTASANATAAQNAVTNAELFTPYAAVSDIPSNNIASITVTAGGSVYETVPAVTITNTTGATGSGATATAVLTDGVVTSITVNTKGNDYDNGATVAIAASTGTDGTDATATAVLGPVNEEKAEIADSTGLETFTPLTGKPAGFILGDDGLTVKIKYNTSSTTWEWVNYYSNDPETRYRKKIIIENKRIIDEDYAVGVDNNGFSVGPVSIANNKILTIPNNSTYLVL